MNKSLQNSGDLSKLLSEDIKGELAQHAFCCDWLTDGEDEVNNKPIGVIQPSVLFEV